MDNLTLRQLRYFEALAKHRHFGRAAEVCAVSQPALSVQIRTLEEALGLPLFERGPRAVRLTAFGRDFAARVRRVLRDVDELAEMARAAQTGLVGRLAVGVIPTIAPYLLPRLLPRLGTELPQLDLQIRETVTPRLIEELSAGRIDAAIVALPVAGRDFAAQPLFSEAFMLVRPAAEAAAPVPTPRALGEMRLLMLEEGHCFRDQALAFCQIPASVARAGLEGSSLSTLVQMVGAGLGVTLIPAMAAPVEARAAPVCVQPLGPEAPERTIGLIWRASSPLAAQLQNIARIITEISDQPAGKPG